MQKFDTISNSCIPVDILDKIHDLINIGYSSYYELDQELKMNVLEAHLASRGISIYDIQTDLDIEILFTENTTLDNMIHQIFAPIDKAYSEDINDLFISSAMDREHPNEQFEDYLPDDHRY